MIGNRLIARITGWVAAVMLACAVQAQNQNVTVDDQPTAEQHVVEVRELRQAGRTDQAVELMQELIEGSRFKLVGLGDGNYADVERWCRAQLLTDPALRNAYRVRFAAAAERELNLAIEAGYSLEALQEVYRRYTVTDSGMQAGMLLVGLLLESGEVLSAKSLIDELKRQPDREADRGRLVYLQGASAVYTQEKDVVEDAIDQLKALGFVKRATQLAQLAQSATTAVGAIRPALLDAGEKPQALGNPLWSNRIYSVPEGRTWVIRDGFTLPRITGSLALINNGRQVVAFDRASGQRAWAYPEDDDGQVSRGPGGLQRFSDARSVAFGGGVACAVLGECYGITDARNPYVVQNRLVCIDPQTGRARWERPSGVVLDHEPTLDQDRRDGRVNLRFTHFVGTPVITRGRVLAMLRRANSSTNTQHNWLLCFDAEDGSLLWYRHLSILTISGGRDISKTTPQIGLHGETAYITDGIATVGAIDIQSGGYQWLRVLPVGYGSTQRLTLKTRGPLSPPVATRAGLLVCLSLDREPMMLLDPEDGSVLQSFDEHPKLGNARYMLDALGGAVMVAYDSISFWNEMDAQVRWTFTLGPDEQTVGRGDVTAQYIVMPTNKRIVVLDRETGELVDQAQLVDPNRATNIVARDGELFVIHDSSLSLIATWDSVFQRLVKRVKESPGDPSGGIALASLALKQQGLEEEVLQGIAYALDAIDHQPPDRAPQIRELVFNQVRKLTPLALDAGLRGALYDRMALVSQTAEQEATYHLDAGHYYIEQGDIARAVGHFHAVLAEPTFASQPYQRGQLTRPAGRYAKQQVQSLIDTYGPGVYARYDAMAQAWISQVKSQGTPDAATLINIARRFPLSVDTVEILLEAGGLNAQQGNRLEAESLFQQAVIRSATKPIRERAVGQLLAFYFQANQASSAMQLIDRQAYRDASLRPVDPATGEPVALEQWRQRAGQLEPVQRSGRDLGSSAGKPIYLPGRLVAYAEGVEANAASPRFYLQHADGTLACHLAEQLDEPAWSATLDASDGALFLLAENAQQVLFWAPDQGVLIALDPGTGQQAWRTAMPLPQPGPQAEFARPQPGDLTQARFVVTVSNTVLCIGLRKSSELFAIDRSTGSLIWRKVLDMRELAALTSDAWSVIAVGSAGHIHNNRNGRVQVLDLFSGEPARPNMHKIVALTPMALYLDKGRLLIVGSSGVAQVSYWTGKTDWVHRFQGALTGISGFTGQMIAVAGINSVVYLLNTQEEGRHFGQVLIRSESDGRTVIIQSDGEHVFLAGGMGLFCVEGMGSIVWQATKLSPAQHPIRLIAGDTHVAVFTVDKAADGLATAQRLSLFERKGGRLASQYSLAQFGEELEPADAMLAGSSLLVPAGDRTLVVPTAAE